MLIFNVLKVYALDSSTGEERWRVATGGYVGSSAAVDAAGRVFVGSDDGSLRALNGSDGGLLWQVKPRPRRRCVRLERKRRGRRRPQKRRQQLGRPRRGRQRERGLFFSRDLLRRKRFGW